MAGRLRIPRDAEELDRLLFGDGIHASTSRRTRSLVRQLRLELFARAAIWVACLIMIVCMGIEWTKFFYDDAYGLAYAGPWPALVVSMMHIFFRPLLARMSAALDHCQNCSQTVKRFQQRAAVVSQLVDIFNSILVFVAAVTAFLLTGSRSRPLSTLGGMIGLGISFSLMFLGTRQASRLRIHISMVPANDEDADDDHTLLGTRSRSRLSPERGNASGMNSEAEVLHGHQLSTKA